MKKNKSILSKSEKMKFRVFRGVARWYEAITGKQEYKISFTALKRKYSIEKAREFEGSEMHYITEYGVEKI